MLERYDNYQLVSKIASGGMADIFLAKHVNSPANSMPIAIKKIKKQHSSDPVFIEMFLAEAKNICSLNHENIVKIYDFGKFDDQYFIAMEFVFGQDLGSILKKLAEKGEKMPLSLTLEVMLGVLAGLDHAHNACGMDGEPLNIIHMDMNPNNILISYDGKIKIVDFGISQTHSGSKGAKQSAGIRGTYAYLSPEQCREEQVDRRSDIFSVGIILYEMLTGKPLFKQLESDAAIINAIVNSEITPIEWLLPDIDPRLSAIVSKALAQDPDLRYSTAAEMRDDIMQIYNSLEFDPSKEMLYSYVKKLFPAHFIKITKLIEQAQTEYLMDELFNDIGEFEELDQKQKKKSQEEVEHKENNEKKRKNTFLVLLGSGIFIGLLAILALVKFSFIDPDVKTVTVTIFSDPSGAEIYLDGEFTGKMTSTELLLEIGKEYIIEFKKGDLNGGVKFTPTLENRYVNMVLQKRDE